MPHDTHTDATQPCLKSSEKTSLRFLDVTFIDLIRDLDHPTILFTRRF